MSLDFLASSLDDSCREGHLPDPGTITRGTEEKHKSDTAAYILTLRGRLINLGYLRNSKKNRDTPEIDKHLLGAIKKFQREAGLKQDSWAGPVTWNTLQQLVSFEDDQDCNGWSISLNSAAVARATYLRLYAFGFMDWESDRLHTSQQVNSRNLKLRKAIRRFSKTCIDLGLCDSVLESVSVESINLIFGQDALIQAIDANISFFKNQKNDKFLLAIGRIELWLLGYEVPVGPVKANHLVKIKRAFKSFWEDNKSSSLYPSSIKARQTVTTHFFRQLIEFEQQSSESELAESIDQSIRELSKTQQLKVQEQVANLSSSIWDGLKRLLRWVKRLVGRLVESINNLVKNMARLIARSSRQMFHYVLKAIEIVYRGIVYYSNRMFLPSSIDSLVIQNDGDFDLRVFKSVIGANKNRESVLQEFKVEAQVFSAACHILGVLLSVIKQVLRSLKSGMLAWFALLESMTVMHSRLNSIKAEIDAIEALELQSQESFVLTAIS